ncbi:MAG TPA: carboxypeptidase-like regulatory domain-containing protein [Bryobacteraceae bacterium]|nr:carboxypeptidase-like regulatory domain-containing protein [Bryobacteraceae bacterium]
MNSKLPFAWLILTLLAVSSLTSNLLAQSAGTAGLTGTITDPTGAVVPGVTVTLTNADTNQSRTTTSNGEGVYKFSLIPPGNYKVKFAASGFKPSEVPSVTLNVTETPVLDGKLQVGAANEQVTVEAAAEALQTSSSTLGTTVTSSTVTALPLSSRNYTQILGLAAGASTGANNATAFGKGTQDISTNGADPGQNNYQMDGVAINNIANPGTSADSGIYAGIGIPSPDAIQEFKIQTSTYDASYGRNPGANVNVVTKSGTNSFHGTAFEFFRNSQMNANDFFYNRDTCSQFTGSCPKQVLNQNQFGGVIGGPIKRDKVFFFASYQGTRQKNGVASQGLTPGANLPPIPAGDRSAPGFAAALAAANCNFPTISTFVEGGAPLACDGSNISPVALKILQLKNPDGSYYFPGSKGPGFQTVNFSDPAIYNANQLLLNGDYIINDKNTLAMRYFYTRDPQLITLNGFLPGTPVNQYYSNTNAVLKLTTIVSNTFVNEIHGSFQRNVSIATDQMPAGFTNENLGITGLVSDAAKGGINTAAGSQEPPFIVLATNGFNLFQWAPSPSYSPTSQIQIGDQISWTHGRHTIRAGFEYEETQWNIVFAGLERGFLIFLDFNSLLVGGPSNILECLFCTRSGPDGIIHGYRLPNMNSYVQDDWKVSNKLTLNLGVRWEYDGMLSDKYGNLTTTWLSKLVPNTQVPTAPTGSPANYGGWIVPNNFVSHYGQPPAGVFVSPNSVPLSKHPPYSNFGPRVGFAYQLTDKIVLRGGAGIFYDRVGANQFVHSVEQGNPYAITVDYVGSNPYTLANPFPALPALGTFSQRYANLSAACQVGVADTTAACNSYLNVPFVNEMEHTPTVRQYNFNVQYQFAPTWVLELGYVGSSGINLTDYNHNYNTARLASPSNPINGITTNSVENVQFRVPYLGYQAVGLQGTAYDLISNYNSLQATLRKQFSHGLTLQAAYTFSKSLSNSNQESANSNDASNTAQQYGPSWFNRPNRFVINYSYDLPFGKHTGLLNGLLGGWNLSGVTTIQSGDSFSVMDSSGGTIYGTSSTTTSGGFSRAQFCPGTTFSNMYSSGGTEARLGGPSGGPGWFSANAFCPPPAIGDGTDFGNTGAGIAMGPGQFNFDVTLQKTTKITERSTLLFRAEFFNLFNHPQFMDPNTAYAVPANFALPDVNAGPGVFGRIIATSVSPRVIQLGLKFIF